jgi:tetratricopeptide (TPR) repeat protein
MNKLKSVRTVMSGLIFFMLVFPMQAQCGKKFFSFNKSCQVAYYDMMSLHINDGKKILQQEEKGNPDNLIPYFIENYGDFFTVVINEDQSDLDRLEKNMDARLELIKEGDKTSPYYLYCQAEINLQWALAKIKFEEYFTALMEVKRGYNMLLENEKKFPDFIANKKSLSMIHACVGTVPDNYKWAVRLLGFDGTIEQGMKEAEQVMDYSKSNSFIFHDETMMIYIFLLEYLKNDPKEAWGVCESADYPVKGNLLAYFLKADIAMKSFHNDSAIELLSNCPVTGFNFYYLDYLLGIAKLDRLDANANIPLNKFVTEFKGKNYLKDAYQKLAWYYLINGDMTNYKKTIANCLNKGQTLIDNDEVAMREAQTADVPNVLLLKVRLLQDGGYFDRALTLLEEKTIEDFTSDKDKTEYVYRIARIYHESGKTDEAIGFYKKTIELGADKPYYFAASAALQLGYIYEARNDYKNAQYYYQECLDLPNADYKTSIDQKAKSGLDRLASK